LETKRKRGIMGDASEKLSSSYNTKRGIKEKEKDKETLEEYAVGLQMEEDSFSHRVSSLQFLPEAFFSSYTSLSSFVLSSLDKYKPELKTILYPVFVHSYLDLMQREHANEARQFLEKFKVDHMAKYQSEILRLASIDTIHMKEDELVNRYRGGKFNTKMCSYSFELLIAFIHENNLMLIVRLINQYVNIQVFTGEPQQNPLESLSGNNAAEQKQLSSGINESEILWGNMEPELEEAKKGSVDSVKKARAQEVQAHAPPEDRIPFPKPKPEELRAEAERIRELKQRVTLGPGSLPSISCYTFYNTYDSLCSISMSPDCSLISAGYSDSYIQIHNVRGENLKRLRDGMKLNDLNEFDSLEPYLETTGKKEHRFVGHSGPVYSTSWSPDSRFLISGSEDSTVRLWSLQTQTNLVCYKGHNYPVWSVDFSRLGFYFVSASHDRTARLWSCDHIYPLRIFAGHTSDVDVVKFHPNSNYVATGSSDKTVRLWDIQKGNCVRIFTGHVGSIYSLAFSADGQYLASGSAENDGTVIIWDLASGKKLRTLKGCKGAVYSVDFSTDSNLVAAGGADNCVRIWDAKGQTKEGVEKAEEPEFGTLLGSFPTKSTPIQLVKFSYRNVLLVAGAFQS